jgi:hypothetical protein
VKRFKAIWQSLWIDVDRRVRLGRVLGMIFVTAGFIIAGFAWNGAASKNLIQSQFPYLLSGGIMGLGLIILGATLWMLSTIRGERQVLTEKVDEMIQLLARNLLRSGASPIAASFPGSEDQVVATKDSYHRAGCRVLEGKTNLVTLTVAQAVAEGLATCRVCDPPGPAPQTEETEAPAEAADEPAAEKPSAGEPAAEKPSEGDATGASDNGAAPKKKTTPRKSTRKEKEKKT